MCFLFPVLASAWTPEKTLSKRDITSVIAQCRQYEGTEVVQIGSFGTGAIKGIVRIAAQSDPDAREALKLMKGLRGISIFEFEDCSAADKERIVGKLDRVFSGSDLLIEASDGSEKMKIYGVFDEQSGTVQDFVLYAPSDCALICLFGSISMDAIAQLVSK